MLVTSGHKASCRDDRHDVPCRRSVQGKAYAEAALDGAGAGAVITVLLAARRLHHHRHRRDVAAGLGNHQRTTNAASGTVCKNLRLAACIGDGQRQRLISQRLFIAQVAATGLDIGQADFGQPLECLAVGIETVDGDVQLALCLVTNQAALRLPFPLGIHRQRQGLDVAVVQAKLFQCRDGGINLPVDVGFQCADIVTMRTGTGVDTETVGHGLDAAFATDFNKMFGGGRSDGVVAAGKQCNGEDGQPGNRTHAMTPEILVGQRLVAAGTGPIMASLKERCSMNEQQVRQAVGQIIPDDLGVDLRTANVPVSVSVDAQRVTVDVALGYPAHSVAAALQAQIEQVLAPLLEGRQLAVTVQSRIDAHRVQADMAPVASVRNVIAVASGKGGVGKSTTAVNLALALQAEGARVGILDADVFGPSVPTLLGVAEGTRPAVRDNRFFLPVIAHGLQSMSMGYLVDEDSPVVWRGPKASGALTQLFAQTLWDDLDYLVVDMPPGTGDIQLTLAQKVPVAGAVIVTTPQDLALVDAVKGIEMFRKVGIGVLGIVENMAVHVCSQCGHAEHIFGAGGAAKLAHKYETELLGALPLSMSIREQADGGQPTVIGRADSPEAACYRQVARRVAARLSLQGVAPPAFPRVITQD